MDDFFTVLQNNRDKKSIIKNISSLPSNYVGSKRRLLLHIWDTIEKENIEFNSAFDAFSGSGMVSLMFKAMGKDVICNDILTSSAMTSVCLLENDSIPLSNSDIKFLCKNEPSNCRTFALDSYKDTFFTEKECRFLDRYRRNVEILCGDKFYCGLDLVNKSWTEKWNGINKAHNPNEYNKYKGAFSLMAIENHINKHCFLGGRYYKGQIIADLNHRINHDKNKGKDITDIKIDISKFKNVMSKNKSTVFNSDIIELLESNNVNADLVYIDPPYGGASSDYSTLYRFLEEFLYEDKLENLEHIQKGSRRFSDKKGYQSEFEHFLDLCSNFKTWILSYNDSSYANIETITSTVKNAGRKDIKVIKIPITYQYRKGKNRVDANHFFNNYLDNGHKYTERGIEYLIVAR